MRASANTRVSLGRGIPLTQAQRVLRHLRERGARGTDASEWLLPHVVDGGKPIARLAARIEELRSKGLTIVTEGKRHGYAVYVLREQAAAAVAAPAAETAADQLFTDEAPRSAIHGWEDAA